MRLLVLPILLLGGLACAGPEEESVKPGINDSFLDPEMSVDDYVRRFEVESREIYVQRHQIAEQVGLEPGMEVADVGAGTGLFEPIFSQAVGEEGLVYAVELSPGMLEHLEQRKRDEAWVNVVPVQCTDRDVSLAPRSVDRVFLCDTYHHFEYPRTTMRTIRKAMRPDAELIIVDFERIPGVSREWILGHVRAGKEVVIAELESFGFELIEEVDMPGLEENYLIRLRLR